MFATSSSHQRQPSFCDSFDAMPCHGRRVVWVGPSFARFAHPPCHVARSSGQPVCATTQGQDRACCCAAESSGPMMSSPCTTMQDNSCVVLRPLPRTNPKQSCAFSHPFEQACPPPLCYRLGKCLMTGDVRRFPVRNGSRVGRGPCVLLSRCSR